MSKVRTRRSLSGIGAGIGLIATSIADAASDVAPVDAGSLPDCYPALLLAIAGIVGAAVTRFSSGTSLEGLPARVVRRLERLGRVAGALHEYRARCRVLQQNMSEIVIVAASDGRVLHFNSAGKQLLAIDGIGVCLSDLLDEASVSAWQAAAAERQGSVPVSLALRGPGDTKTETRGTIDSIPGSGRECSVLAVLRDVTELNAAERALAQTESRVRAIFEHVPDSVFTKDMDLRYTLVNPAVEALFDLPADQLIGKDDGELFGEETGRHICEVDGGVLRGGTLEEEHSKPVNGVMKTFHVVKVPLREPDGTIVGLCGIARDVTARKQAEDALRKSEEKWRRLFHSLPGGSFVVDDRNIIVDANEVACRATGYTREELIGAGCEVICPKGPRLCPIFHLGNPGLSNDETSVKAKDGRLIPVLKSAARIPLGDREAVVENFQDLTGIREAERAIRQREEAIRALLNATPEAMYMLDSEGRLLSLNEPMAKRLCSRIEDLIGKSCYELLPGDMAEESRFHFERVMRSGRPSRFESSRDGRFFDTNMWPVRNDDGEADRVVVSSHDITELKLLEERLTQAAKLEAISQLAGGIAHDFNNLLTGILGYADMLKDDTIQPDVARNAARTIEKAARRASELTQQLLGFARKGKHQIVPVAIDGTVQEVVELLKRTLDKSIAIRVDLRAGKAFTMGDPSQIHQVLLNLALNARDAMPRGGELAIATSVCDVDIEQCRREADLKPGTYLKIQVTDTGQGIPKEIAKRIFEPFFTTKEQGQGTGMGLAMVYGIVKNHGGSIQVYSEPGFGSTFRIYLPISGDQPAEARSKERKAPRRGSGTVLLVDDEEVVREVAADMLRSLGYKVVTAASGHEALDYYSRHGSDVDLALIDLVMPGMGGKECFLGLREMNPDVRAVLSSGYGINGRAQETIDEGMLGFIQKPYQLATLADGLHKALSG